MSELLISADSHVAVSQDQIRANLPAKFHDAYNDALRAFGTRMAAAMGAGNANADSMKRNQHAAFKQAAGGTDDAGPFDVELAVFDIKFQMHGNAPGGVLDLNGLLLRAAVEHRQPLRKNRTRQHGRRSHADGTGDGVGGMALFGHKIA